MKRYFYIYEITNLSNGKTYIGKHATFNLNDGYMGSGKVIKHAIKKYGKQNFKKEILMFAVNDAALNFIEKCLVTSEYATCDSNYNLREGGSRGSHSEETRKKLSLSHIGKSTKQYITDTTRQKLSDLRKNESNDTKIKRSMALSGKKHKVETREHFSKTRSRPFPTIRNIHTNEIVNNGIGASNFCRHHGLNKGNFCKMLRGKKKTCKGWVLY